MTDEALLSDLCSICYTDKPKYKCPRCKTQTCSLPCYKKHQLRASCSGKRDPAAYLKKSQWATPSGIDQDYNYLKNVERNIEHANGEVHSRGIGVRSQVSKNIARGLRPDSVLQRYLADNQITIEHAPTGMSRQKLNKTRPTKRGNIVWTVEWRNAAGKSDLQNDCLESATICALYDGFQVEKRNKAKPRSTEEESASSRGTKRKRDEAKQEAPKPELQTVVEDSVSRGESAKNRESVQTGVTGQDERTLLATTDTKQTCEIVGRASESDTQEPQGKPANDEDATSSTKPEHEAKEDNNDQRTEPYLQAITDPTIPTLYFYLLKPGTASPVPVLYPLSATSTLTEALRRRLVQEYPTIFALPHSAEALPPDFILETDNALTQKRDDAELKGMLAATATATATATGGNAEPLYKGKDRRETETVDAQGILDMLQRDVTV